MYSRKIVLDFDGTIFRLFANYSLENTIIKINECMKCYGINFPLGCDAFDSFYYANSANLDLSIKQELLLKINEIIVKAEIEAISSGVLIDGFYDFLEYSKKTNISIGIASNNSKECINEFKKKYCPDLTVPIVGRNPLRPDLMKPNPIMLNQICTMLSCDNKDIVFIGDNIRDYQCALNFGVDFIALTSTNKDYEQIIKSGLTIKKVDIVRNFFELMSLLINK